MSNDIRTAEMLQKVLDAKFASRLSAIQTILQREQSLRQSLRDLRERSRVTQATATASMKTIGADVIWQSWIEKKSRELNMELAQVLVQKEQGMRMLRTDFGRKQAGEEVQKGLSRARDKMLAKRRNEALMAHLVQSIEDRHRK